MNAINNLTEICKKSQAELLTWLRIKMLDYYTLKNVKITSNYLYVKGTLPICLVAHLDTVHASEPTTIYYDVNLKNLFSPTGIGGDDRCGVYIILELLKRGFRPSIIFCCDEEIGMVGAQEFTRVYKTIKNVNWFLEFDRRGRNDVVAYDDDNDALTNIFESFGFKSAWGSFSDISTLAPAYGISAVNVSSGYYAPHTSGEYINMFDLEWIIDTVEKVLNSEYVNNKYKYIERQYSNYGTYYQRYGGWSWNDDLDYEYDNISVEQGICNICGKAHSVVYESEFGAMCGDCLSEYEMEYCPHCKMYVMKAADSIVCDTCGTKLEGRI